MCGRYTLEINERFDQRFHITESSPKMQSRYNIAPSQLLPVVIENKIKIMKWGIVPFWSKTGKDQIINVRAETAGVKPMFKKLIEFQRCLIPATGFIEWKRDSTTKTPYFIHLKSKDYFAFAGIYDKDTYAILTTTPNNLMEPIHNRMPVILDSVGEDLWSNNDTIDIEMLTSLLHPFDERKMDAYPVSTKINNPLNNDKNLLHPANIN